MKNIFANAHIEYKKVLKKLQKDEQQKMFDDAQEMWEKFMKKVYKTSNFSKRQIEKLGKYTSSFSKKHNTNLSLPLALLDQVAYFYITEKCSVLEVEPLKDDETVDGKLLNHFFSEINMHLFQENMPFRWHHNTSNKESTFIVEIVEYRTR